MKLVIPFLGKTKSAWIEAGIQDYAARLIEIGRASCRERV